MLIRKLRLQRGWSQEHLARLSDLSVRTIQRVERGHPPSLETRNALSAVFGVDLSTMALQEQSMSDSPDQETLQENSPLKSEEARALEYVQGIKAFYQHLTFYLLFLVIFAGGIWLVHKFIPSYIQFTMVGWGFGVIVHGLNAFEVFSFFGPDWEKRRVEKRLGRKL